MITWQITRVRGKPNVNEQPMGIGNRYHNFILLLFGRKASEI